MNDGNTQEHRPRGPRLYHKKSRTGCMRCKQRRVKCDEVRPSCGSCSRHAVECVYLNANQAPAAGRATSTTRRDARSPVYSGTEPGASNPGLASASDDASYQGMVKNMSSLHSSDNVSAHSPHSPGFYPSPSLTQVVPADDGSNADISLPEGPWRRFWELRLLQNYHTHMLQPFATPQSDDVLRLWQYEIPEMALRMAHQNRCSLLYITFANSALNLWSRCTDEQERVELMKLQQAYQLMCSREQRRDIEELAQRVPENAMFICFTGIRILAQSIALVQTLTVDPWEPPVQWLHLGRGAGEVLNMARKMASPEDSRKISAFVRGPPDLSDAEMLVSGDHSQLDWLLEHPSGPGSLAAQEDRELDDENTKSVYYKALAYICGVQKAINEKETGYAIVRRLGGFALCVPVEFVRFVEERRPRAMVILAHFMALWLNYEHVWMIGRAGELQIRGIYKVLPLGWCSKLDGLIARFKSPEAGRST